VYVTSAAKPSAEQKPVIRQRTGRNRRAERMMKK
jgi:hypothetical protein